MDKRFNRELAATILLAAVYTTDEDACAKFGITTRTLRRYRQRMATDPQLSAIVRTKKAEFDTAWAGELPGALRESIDFIATASRQARNDVHAYRNPAMIEAIAGAMKLCAEVYYTGKLIDARIAPENGEASGVPGQDLSTAPLVSEARQ